LHFLFFPEFFCASHRLRAGRRISAAGRAVKDKTGKSERPRLSECVLERTHAKLRIAHREWT
jgi:hypothetical protein